MAALEIVSLPPRLIPPNTNPRRFVAAWQASDIYEGSDDQRLWITVSLDPEGRKWRTAEMIPALERGRAQWSPVLQQDLKSDPQNPRLLLFYSESRLCHRPPSPLYPEYGERWLPGGDIKMTNVTLEELFSPRRYSPQWSSPRIVLSQGRLGETDLIPKVIANRIAVLSGGTWLLPYWKEPKQIGYCKKFAQKSAAGVLRSNNQGLTWHVHGNLTHERTWLIENTLVERRDGSVLMLFRTKLGVLFQSLSFDQGRTWGEPQPTSIPNPDSKIQALRLQSGHLALVFNDHKVMKKKLHRSRVLLDVAISSDDGFEWERIARVDDEVDEGLRSHYPTMVQGEDNGGLFVVYSKFYHESAMARARNRTDLGIRLVEVDLKGRLLQLDPPHDIPGGTDDAARLGDRHVSHHTT